LWCASWWVFDRGARPGHEAVVLGQSTGKVCGVPVGAIGVKLGTQPVDR
jgi:hypothetical protein